MSGHVPFTMDLDMLDSMLNIGGRESQTNYVGTKSILFPTPQTSTRVFSYVMSDVGLASIECHIKCVSSN